jgi:hypothetical protein
MPDVLGRLQTALADRFRAEDLKHRRQVAIKVLHPDLAAALGGDRFLREIEIAASLNHPHILPLFDSGEAAGLLFYVMPYVEGESLQERLEAEVQLPIDQAVAIAAEVAEGLDYAHRQGVIHRDIKPGNILLSEGHALITDFGIARAIGAATDAEAQTPGLALGTPAYMSPEQGAPAAEVDGRSDVYALGCVLWEMLAGEPPFGGPTPQVILARKAVEEAPDVRGIRGRVPEALGACLEGALAPVPADRFATAAEFASALRNAVLLGVTPQAVARRRRKQRRRWVLAAASVIVAAGGVLAWQTYVARRQVEWARTEAQPEIRRLAGEGKYDSATSVAIRLESILPDEPTLDVPWEYFSHSMTIETEPPGASVYRRPNEAETDTTWQLLGTTPIEGVRLPHIRNRFRFEKEGYDPREFPFDGERIGLVVLDPEHSTPDGMVRVHHFRLESDFYIDVHEVTNRQYKRFVDAGGYRSEEYWVEPFDLDGQTVPLVEAMALLVDRTGRPGPSTWEAGAFPPGQADFPVGGISWYEATAYARFAGRSLPSVRHLRYALRVASRRISSDRGALRGLRPVWKRAGVGLQRSGRWAALLRRQLGRGLGPT